MLKVLTSGGNLLIFTLNVSVLLLILQLLARWKLLFIYLECFRFAVDIAAVGQVEVVAASQHSFKDTIKKSYRLKTRN